MKNFSRQLLLFGLFGILTPTILVAQKLVIENLTPENGLASNQTYEVIQDRFGYMWFACTGGLSRWDGYEMVNFTSNDGLSHSTVLAVIEDPNGDLWVGTENGLHALNHSLIGTVKKKSTLIRSFPYLSSIHKGWISALSMGPDRRLWIAIQNRGLFIVDISKSNDSNAFRQSLQVVNTHPLMNNCYMHSLYDDRQGNIWLCTDRGLFSINKSNFHTRHYTTSQGLISDDVYAVILDEQLILWIGTSKGVNYLDLQSGILSARNPKFPEFTIREPLQCFLTDKNNNLWIGTRNGIRRIEKNSKTITSISTRNGLSDNYIRSIYQDREGMMWFTTDAAGVNYLITEQFHNYTLECGLPSNMVQAFTQDTKGRMWIGTSKGLCYLDKGVFKTVQLKNQTLDLSIWVLYRDPQSRFWVGTQNGVFEINEDGRTLRHLNVENGLVDKAVRDLLLDAQGRLWIATQFGVSVYDLKTEKFTNYTIHNGLPAVYVRSLAMDPFGRIWIGTRGGGLCLVTRLSESAIEVHTYSTHNGMPDNTIGRIYFDHQGQMWVSTHRGAVVMKVDDRKVVYLYHISDTNGLAHNLVSSIQQDYKGTYWICGDKGVVQLELCSDSTKPFRLLKRFDKQSGMAGEEFTTNNSLFLDRNGSLWFGLFGGITVYHPDKDLTSNVPPFVYITNVTLIGKATNNTESSGIPIWQWGNTPMLTHDQNHLNFYYIALSYRHTRQIKYQYYLDGFDPGWSPPTKRREVRYTNLPSGDYIFRVRAITPDRLWEDFPAELAFHISPAFWNTWWFRILGLLSLGLLLYLAYKLRMHQINVANRALEDKIAQRTSELIEKNKELRELNKLKDEFLNIAAHDLRNPLNSVLCTCRIILEDVAKNEYESEKYLVQDVNSIIHSCQHMLDLINNLLDLAKIEAGRINLNLDHRDLNLLIRELAESVEPLAQRKHIRIILPDDRSPVYAVMDKEKIWQAMNNLLSNAIKFTDPGGIITLELKKQESWVIVTVTDTGRGIPADKLDKVFDKFSELSRTGTQGERGTGLGMAITKSIIELHGGRIWLESEVGRGSSFHFSLLAYEEKNESNS